MSIHFRLTCWNPNQKYRTNIFINYLIWIFKRMGNQAATRRKSSNISAVDFRRCDSWYWSDCFGLHSILLLLVELFSNRIESIVLVGKRGWELWRYPGKTCWWNWAKNDAENIGEWRKNYNLIVIKIENVNGARAVMSVIIIWLDALVFHTVYLRQHTIVPKECCKQFSENFQRHFSVNVDLSLDIMHIALVNKIILKIFLI